VVQCHGLNGPRPLRLLLCALLHLLLLLLLIVLTVVLIVLDVSDPPATLHGRRLPLVHLLEVRLRLEHLDLDLLDHRPVHGPTTRIRVLLLLLRGLLLPVLRGELDDGLELEVQEVPPVSMQVIVLLILLGVPPAGHHEGASHRLVTWLLIGLVKILALALLGGGRELDSVRGACWLLLLLLA
jgi:hypothetical protein